MIQMFKCRVNDLQARSKKLALAIGPVFTEKMGKAEDVDQRTGHETPARHSTVGAGLYSPGADRLI